MYKTFLLYLLCVMPSLSCALPQTANQTQQTRARASATPVPTATPTPTPIATQNVQPTQTARSVGANQNVPTGTADATQAQIDEIRLQEQQLIAQAERTNEPQTSPVGDVEAPGATASPASIPPSQAQSEPEGTTIARALTAVELVGAMTPQQRLEWVVDPTYYEFLPSIIINVVVTAGLLLVVLSHGVTYASSSKAKKKWQSAKQTAPMQTAMTIERRI